MVKRVEFIFQFPPIHGVYDTGNGVVYVFGEQHESDIEHVLSHETLHYTLQKINGKKTSLKFDKISGQRNELSSKLKITSNSLSSYGL